MAAYEMNQPSADLNGFYSPSIPVQPVHHNPASRRCRPRCSFCFLSKVAVVVVLVLGAATLAVWLIFRPDTVKAYADSAALSRFDLAGGGGPAGSNLLQYNLTVDIRLRNPNRFGIRYDYAEAQASYDGDRFGFHPVPPFYLDSKSGGVRRLVGDDGRRRAAHAPAADEGGVLLRQGQGVRGPQLQGSGLQRA